MKTAEVQCQRIKVEEELMEAMDEAADRDALHTADINTLNTCLQKAEKVLADADKVVALGAREHNVRATHSQPRSSLLANTFQIGLCMLREGTWERGSGLDPLI